MTQIKPVHYDNDNIQRLNKELIAALLVGGLKGLMFGAAGYFMLSLSKPQLVRRLRTPLKFSWFVSFVGFGAIFDAEHQTRMYSVKLMKELERQEALQYQKELQELKKETDVEELQKN